METKRPRTEDEDRLSSLPDSLLLHILCFLPTTKEAITTSLLSKHWRHIWKSLPRLRFEVSAPADAAFVDRTLARLASPTAVSAFRLRCPYQLLDFGPQPVSWILRSATDNLHFLDVELGWKTNFTLPTRILRCRSLQYLKVTKSCLLIPNLDTSDTFCLHKLRVLHLHYITQNVGDSVGRLVSSGCCPVLEDLLLMGRHLDAVDISAANLRMLSLTVSGFSQIRISCPKLENLRFSCPQPRGLLQAHMPLLASLTLMVPFCASPSSSVVDQLLTAASGIRNLTIYFGAYTAQISPRHLVEERKCFPTLHKLITMQLHSCFHDDHVEASILLLKSSPNLKSLFIKREQCKCIVKMESWRSRKLPDKILHHLQGVKILNEDRNETANMGEFLKFLLTNVGAQDGFKLI